MVLSEAEAERRLAILRREREALDRAIADLTLYLELGRRLTAAAPGSEATGGAASARGPAPFADAAAARSAPQPETMHEGFLRPAATVASSAEGAPGLGGRARAAGPLPAVGAGPAETAHGSPEVKSAETIPEGALARRYGRALVREAVAVLAAADRPLHASEILAALTARGFTVPGQQDPVAALNTRLWKRAAPGGPLRRLGDAVYALAEGGARSDRAASAAALG